MVSHLEPDEILGYLEEFMDEHDLDDNQRIATLKDALEEAGEDEEE